MRIDWCTAPAARYACMNWHYSRSFPTSPSAKLGVWEDARFIGCVMFAMGASPRMGEQYGLKQTEVCELVRIALRAHSTPVSRIMAVCIRLLRKQSPGLRMIVSFADPSQGHHGGVYQATGWIYSGTSDVSHEYVINGKRMHARSLAATRKSHSARHVQASTALEWARLVLDPAAHKIAGSAKHRYLYPLDEAMRVQVVPLAQPYPKRAVEQDRSG